MRETITRAKIKLLGTMGSSKLPLISHPKVVKATDTILTLSFIRYLIIGFSTFGFDFAIFFVLDRYTPVKALAANITSTFITLIFNFYMSNFWTFKAGAKGKTRKLKKYSTLAIFNYIFNNTTFWIVSVNLGVSGLITKVFITGAIVCWNFFLYKFWIFRRE